MSSPAGERPDRYKWLAMLTVSIGTFMATLDASIVNVSWPTIMSSLHADRATTQWVVAIYLLVVTGLLLTFGRLADLRGRKPIFITGFVVFTLGSVLCGLSTTVHLLILFRAIQGIGAAMIMANGPAIVTHAFPREERGKAMGLMGTTVATGLMTGPALGGFLISDAGWPWIFFINLPIGIVGILIAWRVLRPEPRGYEAHFDIPGAALLILALTSLTLALNKGPETGWSSVPILGLIAAFLVFGALFLRREQSTVHPVIDLALFRNRLFAAASVSAFIAYVALFAVIFQMPFYLSNVLGFDPQRMGIVLTVVPMTALVVAPLSGILSDRFGSRFLGSLGLGIAAVGLFLLSRLRIDTATAYIECVLKRLGNG